MGHRRCAKLRSLAAVLHRLNFLHFYPYFYEWLETEPVDGSNETEVKKTKNIKQTVSKANLTSSEVRI